MKKILLSILVVFTSYIGVYASNEEPKENYAVPTKENVLIENKKNVNIENIDNIELSDDCFYSITYRTSWGQVITREQVPMFRMTGSYSACSDAVEEKINELKSWNYHIISYSFTYGEHW